MLLRLGVDRFGILSHYDRILVALSAVHIYFIPSDVMVLKPLDGQDISPEFGLYLATQLNVAFSDADYVNSVTLKQLKETEIEVPVTEKGEIDYDAVSDKMRPIMEKARTHVDKLAKQYEQHKRRKSNGKL